MGTAFWMAPFYSRTFGWSPQQYGIIQGFLTLILAPAGLLFGGWLAERLSKRGVPDANLRVVFMRLGAAPALRDRASRSCRIPTWRW